MNGGVGGPVVGSKGLANRFACAHQMLQLRIKTTEGIFNVRSVDATSPTCCLMDWPMLESEGSCLTPALGSATGTTESLNLNAANDRRQIANRTCALGGTTDCFPERSTSRGQDPEGRLLADTAVRTTVGDKESSGPASTVNSGGRIRRTWLGLFWERPVR